MGIETGTVLSFAVVADDAVDKEEGAKPPVAAAAAAAASQMIDVRIDHSKS